MTRFQGEHIGNADQIKVPEVEEMPTDTRAIAVQSNEQGQLVGKTLDEQWRLAVSYSKSGLLPKHFNTPEKILTAMQFAYELGLKPLSAMRQIAVINGIPSMYGDLPLAVCKASGKVEYVKEYYIDKTGKRISEANNNLLNEVVGAVCTTKRKGEDNEVTTVFTYDDAKKAGIFGKNVWAVYPKRMLQMRARSQNLKDNFPDMLNGVSIAEYDHNVNEKDIETITERPSAQDLNARLEALPTHIQPEKVVNEVVNLEEDDIPLFTIDRIPEDQIPTNLIVEKPKSDFVFSLGRYEGVRMDSISTEDLKTYLFQLKSQAKLDGKNATRDVMIEQIALFVGVK